jgi:hypothetical protein
MKINTLLIAAATLAVGAISSQAQVYSQNVVGYVNLVCSNGYNAFTMPVDYDGTGTNNVVTAIISTNNLPIGTQILSWNGAGFLINGFISSKGKAPVWQDPTAKYNPGQGLFINNPSNAPVTITISGTVLQGGLTNGYLTGAGLTFLGNQFPVSGGITSTYGYVPSVNDQVLSWTGTGYAINGYISSKGKAPVWQGGEPQLSVGQAVFLNTTNTHPVWGTNFVIQ